MRVIGRMVDVEAQAESSAQRAMSLLTFIEGGSID
jgi:hypothetical protein